jgi:hypothetical protein
MGNKAERRLLVIGSQNRHLQRLSFLPAVAEDLYHALCDPDLGGCVSALGPDESGLLLDPTTDLAYDVIQSAFQSASQDESTLILAYVGHGEYMSTDFYLMPENAPFPPTSRGALHLVQLIKELHQIHSSVDGLIVLIDACFSGVAATDASTKWIRDLGGTLRFVVLTAVADRPAADACFTRNLVEFIRTEAPVADIERR